MNEKISEILMEHKYQLLNYLNKGACGWVFTVFSLKYNAEFVCKVSFQNMHDTSIEKSFNREVQALTTLVHPNIVRIYDVFKTDDLMFIIMEYCKRGSLLDRLKNSAQPMDAKLLEDYAREIIEALDYMHSKGFAHCDIKPANIMIDEHGRVKLADFGLSHPVNQTEECQFCGSLNYMSPEILCGLNFDPFQSDVWALGVTLYLMLTLRIPYKGRSYHQVMKEIDAGYRPIDEYKEKSPIIVKIIQMCLQINPEDRITISGIKKLLDRSKTLIRKHESLGVCKLIRRSSRIIVPGNRRLTIHIY